MPAVSVIIPVLNDPTGLAATLDALEQQSLRSEELEIIVVDNGSTDGTPRVAARYGERIPQLGLASEKSVQSSYAARNRGIESATARVLAFTDADCRPAKDWLEMGLRSLDRGADAAAGRVEMVFKADSPNLWEYLDAGLNLDQARLVGEHGFGATANLFVRQELFDRVGVFRGDLKSGGDYEFGRRVTRAGGRIHYDPDAVVRHPARSELASLLAKTKRVARGLKTLERLGLLEHYRLSWRRALPARRYPIVEAHPPTALRWIGVFFGTNMLKYWGLMWRVV
jgi:glycosyltransferase involved in cell wall biosynthesis